MLGWRLGFTFAAVGHLTQGCDEVFRANDLGEREDNIG